LSEAKNFVCFISFFLVLKARLQELKFEFCQISWSRATDKMQLTGKISLKLDSNSSSLLEYGRYCQTCHHIFWALSGRYFIF